MSVVDQARGRVAVIRSVDPDLNRVTVEYRNGDTGWFARPPQLDLEVGSVWLVGDGAMVPAEDDLWPGRSTFAVVAAVLEDSLIIDHQGRMRSLTVDVPSSYKVGNTIELDILDRVMRVVSDRPLRPHGLGDPDEDPVAGFRRERVTGGPGFESFGGYSKVVARARELVEAPLRWRSELAAIGARPVKGVLFAGPPGTGKTKLASLIANESSASFYEVSGPAIVSKWVGDSEKALRSLFGRLAVSPPRLSSSMKSTASRAVAMAIAMSSLGAWSRRYLQRWTGSPRTATSSSSEQPIASPT
jgi:transitional endoplasmic reticulum ATPase